MGILEDLERQRNKLKAQREVKEDMAKRNLKIRQVKAEIRREKNPGLYRIGAALSSASKKGVKAAVKYSKTKPKKISKAKAKKYRGPASLSQTIYGGY